MKSQLRVILPLLPLLLLIGCGPSNPPTYEVLGTVEFEDGTKPKFGDIEFYSAQFKVNARGKIERDGTFSVSTYVAGDGAVSGTHDIVVMQQVGSYLMANSENQINHDHGALLDPAYFDYRTSDLSCEIKPGTNQVNLVVKKRKNQTDDGLVE